MLVAPLVLPSDSRAIVAGDVVVNFGVTAMVESIDAERGPLLVCALRQRWYANPEKCRAATADEADAYFVRRYGR